MKSFIHTTKDGRQIALQDLTNSHLINTIGFIERAAERGVSEIHMGCVEDPWYDEAIVFGKDAKDLMNYDKYVSEAKRRGLLGKQINTRSGGKHDCTEERRIAY